jgi:hypothetical protein
MSTKPIPAGHHTVAPYLAIKNNVEALDFYKEAFGAAETFRLMMPDGPLGHGEIRLGDSVIMLSDEFPEYDGGVSPKNAGRVVRLHPLMSQTWTPSSKRRSLPAPGSATGDGPVLRRPAPASLKTRSVISGGSPLTRRTSR